jgi:hypothetical protein
MAEMRMEMPVVRVDLRVVVPCSYRLRLKILAALCAAMGWIGGDQIRVSYTIEVGK